MKMSQKVSSTTAVAFSSSSSLSWKVTILECPWNSTITILLAIALYRIENMATVSIQQRGFWRMRIMVCTNPF